MPLLVAQHASITTSLALPCMHLLGLAGCSHACRKCGFVRLLHGLCTSCSSSLHCPTLCAHAAKPELPPNFEEVTWAKLQDAVRAVHEKRPVACSLEELYAVGVISV